jgi:hypothetical protein
MAQPTRPRNPYELIGLVKGLQSPDMKKMALHLKQQILINILLSYINNIEVTRECFAAGFDSLSNDLKAGISIPPSPPPA